MSFGEELKRERELREISLREISESTKISLRYLEALERNDFKSLPGGVFNRGFVRAYSEFIGVDPESMVDAYMVQEASFLGAAANAGLNPNGTAGSSRRLLWVWWIVAALVIGAAAYFSWTSFKPAPESPAAVEQTVDDTEGAP